MFANLMKFRGAKPALALLLVFGLAACAGVASRSGGDPVPVQSPNDDKAYRLLTLDNGLEVLLISDPETPKAAAALDVEVGSGDNPADRAGLAHFLEHMLFLGTDKYPDPAEYEEFITEHGGTRNAYTSFDNTNYFFDVGADYLPGALDRFAQFFISPRFDEAYVEREKNAVQAEYQMGLKSDPRRGLDVLQEVMNPEHPYSLFTVGSLDTLADRPDDAVRDDLLAFYDKHYSASAMRLVVLGKEPLDALQALTVPLFSQVPNRDYSAPQIDAPLFAPDDLPMLVKVRPQATLRQLEVSFPVADYRDRYRLQPLSYLGNLVGHEGEGSLLSELKAEGLAESLAAGSGLNWRGGELFSVTVSLTQQGVAQYERVLQLLFAYLDMLRDEGPQQWLYDEQSQVAALQFRFRENPDPMNYVSALASRMQVYAPEDVLRGPYLMDDYDADLIADLFAKLTPANAQVVLTDESVTTDRESRFYQVPYSRQHITAQDLVAWQASQPEEELHLPEENTFIAEDVALVPLVEPVPATPTKVLTEGRQTIWFLQDEEYRLPKGAIYINFRSPDVGANPEQTAAAVLYTALLNDAVNEFTYPAALAGLNFSLYKHSQGISLRLSGYDDKQLVLLERLLEAIAVPDFSADRFANIRADLIRQLENAVAERPSRQAINDLQEALLYGDWGEQALIDALRPMTLADVEAYADRFWASAAAETLIYGNYTEAVVGDVQSEVSTLLASAPAPALEPLQVLKLAANERLQYQVDVPHDDSVVAWYLQGQGESWRDRAATALSVQIIKSGFFQQLRTEQQLGYVVAAISWSQLDVPGMVLLIQSPNTSAPEVAARIDTFMGSVTGSIDEAQFERHKGALLNEILRPDKNLWERAEFYWQSIAKKQYAFDSREQLAEVVRKLSLADWLSYFEQTFLSQPHSLQVVAPGRWGELPEGAEHVYDSAEAIKAGHATYRIE